MATSMSFSESSLQDRYDLVNLSVAGGTQISSRTSTVISKLTSSSNNNNNEEVQKPIIIALTASAKTAGKLISIAEIAKREITAKRGTVFQYNALSSKMVEIPRRTKKGTHRGAEQEGDEVESDDAFEVMGAVPESETVKRNVPVMTVYLSSVSVKELKDAYG